MSILWGIEYVYIHIHTQYLAIKTWPPYSMYYQLIPHKSTKIWFAVIDVRCYNWQNMFQHSTVRKVVNQLIHIHFTSVLGTPSPLQLDTSNLNFSMSHLYIQTVSCIFHDHPCFNTFSRCAINCCNTIHPYF